MPNFQPGDRVQTTGKAPTDDKGHTYDELIRLSPGRPATVLSINPADGVVSVKFDESAWASFPCFPNELEPLYTDLELELLGP